MKKMQLASICGRLVLGVALGVAVGCGDDPGQGTTTEDASGANVIGASGGTIKVGGVAASIPSAALSSDIEISVNAYDSVAASGSAASVPEFSESVESVVVLKPHGTTFEKPVTITLPFDTSAVADTAELVVMRLDDEEDTTWEPAGPLVLGAGEVSFQVETFSVYTLRSAAVPVTLLST
jgi:hypothetical protein